MNAPPPSASPPLPKKRCLTWKDAHEKAAWLDAAASLDAIVPLVRAFAGRFAKTHGPNDNEGIATDLQHFWRDSITYVHDPTGLGEDEFADTATILERGFDDCDGKARGYVACLRAVGFEARILPVFRGPENFVHVQAEVRWPGSEHFARAQFDGWVRAELILAGCELGEDPDDLPRDADGRRVLS